MKRQITPDQIVHREVFEAQYIGIPTIDPAVLKLLSAEGFGRCYMEIRKLYPTYAEAYERLEDIHVGLTGKRHYSGYGSFRRVLFRRMKKD